MDTRNSQTRETKNWQAFRLATEALRDLDRFMASSSKDRNILIEAKQKLQGAVQLDPDFMRARYYAAIVDDLLGNSDDASKQLQELIALNPPFKQEAEYNLAVSYYHLYSPHQIEAAMVAFQRVIDQTEDSALKYMARAGLVRCYAMMVLHSSKAGKAEEAGEYFKKTLTEADSIFAGLRADMSIERTTKSEIEWRVLNGRGVGYMFDSDRETDMKKVQAELRRALQDFEEANKRSPDNWEIICNYGSSHMRMGEAYKLCGWQADAHSEFEKARRYFEDVLSRIRPNYGFALYEMGRVWRLEGNFAQAIEWFERAKAIPRKERNVGDSTIEKELAKAAGSSDRLR